MVMLCLVLFVLCLSRSGKCNFFFFQAELQMVNIFFFCWPVSCCLLGQGRCCLPFVPFLTLSD